MQSMQIHPEDRPDWQHMGPASEMD